MRAKRLLLLPLILAAGCKPPTSVEQLDSILSWIGTAGMTADAWLRHSTPDKYSRETLELSSATVGQISKDLLKTPPPGIDTVALDSVLTRSRHRIALMAELIRDKNAPEFARELDALRADQKTLKAQSDGIESKQ
jgi:hypothetical protein